MTYFLKNIKLFESGKTEAERERERVNQLEQKLAMRGKAVHGRDRSKRSEGITVFSSTLNND